MAAGGEDAGGIRPLRDRLLVERLEEAEVRHGSIVIPDSAKEKPQEGRVIAAGSGRLGEDGKKIALSVKAGDRILFARYAGSEVRVEDRDYLILREEDVLAIVDQDSA
jgi:chaperonin GroES